MLQADTVNFVARAAEATLIQLPGLIIGTLLGFFAAWAMFHLGARRDAQQTARALVSISGRPLNDLRVKLRNIDTLGSARTAELVYFFTRETDVLEEADVVDFDEKINQSMTLDQRCSDAWRDARRATHGVRNRHDALKKRSALPGEARKLISEMPAYRQLVIDAIASIESALKLTRGHASADGREKIDQLTRS